MVFNGVEKHTYYVEGYGYKAQTQY